MRVRIRSGWASASSWAIMPPIEMPTTWARSSSSASSRPAASAARSAIVKRHLGLAREPDAAVVEDDRSRSSARARRGRAGPRRGGWRSSPGSAAAARPRRRAGSSARSLLHRCSACLGDATRFGLPGPNLGAPAPVAQWTEHRTSNPTVAGSNPAGGMTDKHPGAALTKEERRGIATWRHSSGFRGGYQRGQDQLPRVARRLVGECFSHTRRTSPRFARPSSATWPRSSRSSTSAT